jgi:uncharacterized protein
MTLSTLEGIYASILPRFSDHVTIAWQGGEPTLAGLNFFKKAIEYQNKYKRPGQTIDHALQTNGTLLNDDWCVFLRENRFLIGLSIDGPPRLHDRYRVTNRGTASSDQVLRGLELLQKHAVDYNILCVLNNINVHHPEEVTRYLLNMGSRWLQYIPAVEWEKDPADPTRNVLAPYSPDPEAYGRFLCKAFDMWFEKFRKRVSVRIFDAVLNKLVLGQMPFCILDGSCHNQLTIEHDGSVFGCDHFVERRWQYAKIGEPGWANDLDLEGNARVGLTIHGDGYEKLDAGRDIDVETDLPQLPDSEQPDHHVDEGWLDRIDGGRLGTFAQRKQHLPQGCVECEYKPLCHGGCPKHRSQGGDVPEPTVLCESYKMFYGHAMPRLRWLASFLARNQQPPDPGTPGDWGSKAEPAPDVAMPGRTAPAPDAGPAPNAAPASMGRKKPGRNDPCPCGSGLKYKQCHGGHRATTGA